MIKNHLSRLAKHKYAIAAFIIAVNEPDLADQHKFIDSLQERYNSASFFNSDNVYRLDQKAYDFYIRKKCSASSTPKDELECLDNH